MTDAISNKDSTADFAALKVPPHSVEAEQSVLGGLMRDNNAWDKVVVSLIPEDFYRHDHQLIYKAMMRLFDANSPLDVVTLSEDIERDGELETCGGLPYLGELVNNVPSAANIEVYAKIVQERSILRKLIGVTHEIAEECYKPEHKESHELLNDAEKKIFDIAEERPKDGGPQAIYPLVKQTIKRIELLIENSGGLTGISTGFTELDDMTSGMQPADLVIVAGRPSMGKTTFAMNLVENAIMADKLALVFSLEMPSGSLVTRMLSSLGRIDQTNLRNGKLDDQEIKKLTNAAVQLRDKKLFIDDTPGISPMEMRSRARRIAREYRDQEGIGLIMVDYLQLMQIKDMRDNRVGEISEISRSLKAIAKEFDCPVVALSQLNRGLEQRPNKRPVMSDLRESGAIEQDADVIAFVYRDEVYNPDTDQKGVAEIIIGKQRNGPIGTARLAFIGKYTRFENLAPSAYEEYEGYGL